MSKKLARSAIVGGAATAADMLALLVLVQLVGLPPTVANVPALLAGVAVQFFGNKWFAFRDGSRDYARQGALFAVVEAGALLLNALAFHVLVHAGLPYPAARAVGSALVYFAYSYPLWGRVFDNAPRAAGSWRAPVRRAPGDSPEPGGGARRPRRLVAENGGSK